MKQLLTGELRIVFNRAIKHFPLSPEAEKIAWESALARPRKSGRCYTAIAASLRTAVITPLTNHVPTQRLVNLMGSVRTYKND